MRTPCRPRLVNDRRVLDRIEDLVHRVLDGEDEAGGELALGPAGVHERGRVGKEEKAVQEVEEEVFYLTGVAALQAEPVLRPGDSPRDAADHLFGCFDDVAGFVPPEVAAFQDSKGGFGEIHQTLGPKQKPLPP